MKEERLDVNDGGGLFDYKGVIDSLIVNCNELPRSLFNGRNVLFCSILSEMVQKLSILRDGVKNDLESRESIIEEKNAVIKNLLAEINGKDGENNDNT